MVLNEELCIGLVVLLFLYIKLAITCEYETLSKIEYVCTTRNVYVYVYDVLNYRR